MPFVPLTPDIASPGRIIKRAIIANPAIGIPALQALLHAAGYHHTTYSTVAVLRGDTRIILRLLAEQQLIPPYLIARVAEVDRQIGERVQRRDLRAIRRGRVKLRRPGAGNDCDPAPNGNDVRIRLRRPGDSGREPSVTAGLAAIASVTGLPSVPTALVTVRFGR